MADGRSEMSNASGNSRRPTIDSNMSRERSYISRDVNLLVAPTGGGKSKFLGRLGTFSIDKYSPWLLGFVKFIFLTVTTFPSVSFNKKQIR
jgi:hypothetical protein